jgi:orotidine-5'-phosphate decarboxylase
VSSHGGRDKRFFSLLCEAVQEIDSLLCVGLDPDLGKLPPEVLRGCSPDEAVSRFLREVIQITAPVAAAYKPNKAFFDPLPNGLAVLSDICAHIRSLRPRRPVIVDCKVADTPNTMLQYDQLLFEVIGADAIIVNPYLGPDVWRSKDAVGSARRARGVLVRTSNPGAHALQDARLQDGRSLWEAVLDLVIAESSDYELFPVISVDRETDARRVRTRTPSEIPMFFAGVGAQGKNLGLLRWLLNRDRSGVLVGSSRAVLYPRRQGTATWEQAVEEAARATWSALQEQRGVAI